MPTDTANTNEQALLGEIAPSLNEIPFILQDSGAGEQATNNYNKHGRSAAKAFLMGPFLESVGEHGLAKGAEEFVRGFEASFSVTAFDGAEKYAKNHTGGLSPAAANAKLTGFAYADFMKGSGNRGIKMTDIAAKRNPSFDQWGASLDLINWVRVGLQQNSQERDACDKQMAQAGYRFNPYKKRYQKIEQAVAA